MILIKVSRLPSVYRGKRTLAFTISPFVFVRSDFAENKAVLAHEQKHLDQVKETGWFRWYWRYAFNSDFRKQQEAEGYAVEAKVYELEKK